MDGSILSSCRITLLACGLAVGAVHVRAQSPPASESLTTEPTRLQGGIGIVGAVPVGQFHTFVPDGAGGVLGHLDIGLGDSIFSLGGESGWMLYGDETRTVSLATVIPEVPNASIEVNTFNAIFTLHGRLRVQPRRGRWRPYADGLFGFKDIYTKSKVKGGGICRTTIFGTVCEPAVANDQQTQSRDFILSYGVGAGVMIGFSSRERAPRLDVSVRYLRGGRAEYLTEGAIRREGNQLTRDFSRSRTDVVDVYIGVAFGR